MERAAIRPSPASRGTRRRNALPSALYSPHRRAETERAIPCSSRRRTDERRRSARFPASRLRAGARRWSARLPGLRPTRGEHGDGACGYPLFACRAGEHGDGARGYPLFARRAGKHGDGARGHPFFNRLRARCHPSFASPHRERRRRARFPALRVAAQARGDGTTSPLPRRRRWSSRRRAGEHGDGACGYPAFARRAGSTETERAATLFTRCAGARRRSARLPALRPPRGRARRRSALPSVLCVAAQVRGDGALGHPLFTRRTGARRWSARLPALRPPRGRARRRSALPFALQPLAGVLPSVLRVAAQGAETARAVPCSSRLRAGARRRSARFPALRVIAQTRGDGARGHPFFACRAGEHGDGARCHSLFNRLRARGHPSFASLCGRAETERAAIRSSPAARARGDGARCHSLFNRLRPRCHPSFASPHRCAEMERAIPCSSRLRTGARRWSARPLSSPAIRSPFRCLSSAQTRLSMPRRRLLPLRRFANLPSPRRLTRGRAMCILYG